MQQTQTVFVGVDVAKSTLSAFMHDSNIRQDLANEPEAIRQWIERLPANAMIAVESTGRYHEQLVRLADGLGRTVFVLNARNVSFYAKALGARGKADRSDAQVIARSLAEHHDKLKPWTPPTSVQARVQELLRCRAGIATKRSALRQVLRRVQDFNRSARSWTRRLTSCSTGSMQRSKKCSRATSSWIAMLGRYVPSPESECRARRCWSRY